MRFQITTFVLGFAFVTTARPVDVILDASKTLIQDHTVTISVGVRLKGGSILGRGLFERKDFAAGVTTRTLEIDEIVENCEFSWMITNQIPGEPRASHPDLLLPTSFNGVWKGKCEINSDDEIRLATPFQLHEIESNVSDSAFATRKAKAVLASVSPVSSHTGETFSSWTDQTDKKSDPASRRKEKRILAQGDLEFEIDTYWTLEAGGLATDRKTIKGSVLAID